MPINFLDNVQLNQNQLLGARLQVESANSNVTSPVSGQLIYNSTSNKVNYYNGTGWISVPDGVGIGGSGTVGTVPVFVTNTTTLGDSPITISSGTRADFSGGIRLTAGNIDTSTAAGTMLAVNVGLADKDGDLGTSGQLLSSTGTATNWINAPVSYTKWIASGSNSTQDVNDGDTYKLDESTVNPGILAEAPTKSSTTITQSLALFTKNMGTPTAPSAYNTDVLLWGTNTSATTWKVQQSHVDDIPVSAWGDATTTVDMGGFKILDVATPSASTDAANKAYVDANAGTTYTLPVTSGTNAADIKLTDNGGTVASTVNIAGTTNETTVANLASGNITIGLPNDVTLTGDLTVSGGDITLGGTGRIQGVDTVSASTDAASKAYVDASVAGGLNVKGGFNASTGAIASGGNLTVGGSRVAIAIGDYYVVTVAGNFFGNAATPLTPGDSVLVQTAAAAGASVEGDFAVIQSDTDLATVSTVGIGNTNIEGAGKKDGLSLGYSAGTATLGLDIGSLPSGSLNTTCVAAFYDPDDTDTNIKATVPEIAAGLNSITSKVLSSSNATTHTFTHNLGTTNVMVQLIDSSTKETVYASVDRTSTAAVTATTSANASLTALITKIGA